MNTELTIEQRSRRSSIEKLCRISPAYELGYEQGYKEAIDNACDWILDNSHKYFEGYTGMDNAKLISDFRKAISNENRN